MTEIFLLILAIYVAGIWFSPFPYWAAYRALWRKVLFDRTPGIGWTARRKQAWFLTKQALQAPLWTALWYLDELLYPGYRKMEIRPVFLIGGPRNGTTFLHRTLAADTERFFAVRHIEWRFPFIAVQRLIVALGLEDRLKNRSYWPDTEAGREAARMHRNTLFDYEEDGIFFEERFLHHLYMYMRFPYPDMINYHYSFPELPKRVQQRMLDAHRKLIQKVQYLRGDPSLHFLSKEVASNNRIKALRELYPDARFVVIVRPAEQFMGSLMALIRNSTETKTGEDPSLIPGWREAFVDLKARNVALLADLCENEIPADRQVRTTFADFTADIPGGVKALYEGLGETPSEAYLAHLEWINARQKDRSRGYSYSEIDLGDAFQRFDDFVSKVSRNNPQEQTAADDDAMERHGT